MKEINIDLNGHSFLVQGHYSKSDFSTNSPSEFDVEKVFYSGVDITEILENCFCVDFNELESLCKVAIEER